MEATICTGVGLMPHVWRALGLVFLIAAAPARTENTAPVWGPARLAVGQTVSLPQAADRRWRDHISGAR